MTNNSIPNEIIPEIIKYLKEVLHFDRLFIMVILLFYIIVYYILHKLNIRLEPLGFWAYTLFPAVLLDTIVRFALEWYVILSLKPDEKDFINKHFRRDGFLLSKQKIQNDEYKICEHIINSLENKQIISTTIIYDALGSCHAWHISLYPKFYKKYSQSITPKLSGGAREGSGRKKKD